ncbi:hypothetical protein DL95DRAFT_463249 [Leptodontidium sp. 2 PMI_412]|nr:hypothetical protein DL95DRAFT_463249 [Leptodontidium sp. 2 PMI_412]
MQAFSAVSPAMSGSCGYPRRSSSGNEGATDVRATSVTISRLPSPVQNEDDNDFETNSPTERESLRSGSPGSYRSYRATVALVDPTKSQGRAEIITACGYSETARAPNGVETQAMLHNPTFTRSLISVLKQKANANSPMTATSRAFDKPAD